MEVGESKMNTTQNYVKTQQKQDHFKNSVKYQKAEQI